MEELRHARGIVISGGPSSVYDDGCPTMEPSVLQAGVPVLGICYGQQLITQLLGGRVQPGDKGEYGLALLDLKVTDSPLLAGVTDHQQVWMSHKDKVATPPPGFSVLASTSTWETAAIENRELKMYGVQFHPEVVHSTEGMHILSNFLFNIINYEKN